ncbi:MAG TPA: PepSY domain-containing protein [Steroidobacteraceae bacterium]|nr:PepSY domain-containing protein [Steroidobacteraceae bacterium]
MSLKRCIGLALLLAGPGAAGAAAMPEAAATVLTAASMSMDEAVKMAEQRFHARVVKAETQHDNGHTVYVLRLLNESGRVWTVRVDAASGELL